VDHSDPLIRRLRSFACRRGWIELSPQAQRLIGKMLFDPERRVIMDWSGKAGCTIATMMFLRHMGLLEEARQHDPWIHNYRLDVFYSRHPMTAGDLLSRKNVYFKVVRNPFTRVVSSFRNKARIPGRNRKLKSLGLGSIDAITFRQFVAFLESTDLRVRCDVHYRQQVRDHELLNLRRPLVCKLETLDRDLTELNRQHGFQFDLEGLTSDHHSRKNPDWTEFAADVPYREFDGRLPDYRHFYDADLRERVARLYREDLDAYVYDFPWEA